MTIEPSVPSVAFCGWRRMGGSVGRPYTKSLNLNVRVHDFGKSGGLYRTRPYGFPRVKQVP